MFFPAHKICRGGTGVEHNKYEEALVLDAAIVG